MQITTSQLLKVMPRAQANVAHNNNFIQGGKPLSITEAVALINRYAAECGITEPLHWVHFLANVAVESSELRYSEENLNYSAAGLRSTFPRLFPTTAAAQGYQYKPEKIANYVYAWKNGNGSAASGDGWRFRGRGLLQYTGRTNYRDYARWCGYDVVKQPDLLAQRVGAFRSAAHYFAANCLALAAADKGKDVRKRINGGLNGWAQCEVYIRRAKAALL